MMNAATDVVAFHEKYKIDYKGSPRIIVGDLADFRHKRTLDEVMEIKKDLESGNKAMVLDGIIDSIYILLGTAHLCGFSPAVIAEAWNRVHAANMRKERSSPENPGKYGAVGTDIVKPKGWIAPDLSDLCQNS